VSDLGVGGLRATGHRHRPKRGRGCLAALIAVALIAGIGVFAYVKGVDAIKGALSGPEDFSGDGHKPAVTVKVAKGDTATDIGGTLYDAGVVKSVEAFTDAASADERSLSIQVGSYQLLSEMSARSALKVLVNPDSLIKNPTFTIPEGMRAKEILASIADQTDLTAKEVDSAYADTKALGLPDYAGGDPEGFLYPSTYDIGPDVTAPELLAAMVKQFNAAATDADLEGGAKSLGLSPYEIVTVASLLQAEASRPEDMPKVAAVIYNRLDAGMALQFDSTLHYAVESRGQVVAGQDLRDIDSPYNTYKLTGLTPTPIDSPGADAIEAALHPTDANYLYFVTVNLKTGETRFAESYREHLKNVALYNTYCETSDEC
jgi:peptidoglycan lytic transglycosylase G